jgi:sugar lactone lactonase YvrE
VVPVGADFLSGATSWGIKSSPPIRTFGLGKALPGKPFYVTDEAELRTWAADVSAEGRLSNFRLATEQGGEGVTVDAEGNVYVANGEIYVYDPAGQLIDTIEVPERPTQLVFGGADGRTLFIPARSSLYSLRMRFRGQ